MTTYFADVLEATRDVRIPGMMAAAATRHPLADLLEIKGHARDLLTREIYAFDISALNAAADLRIDTPQRIERLIEAVLRSPRRIYLEADFDDLAVIAGNIRGVLDAPAPSEFDDDDGPQDRRSAALRVGAFVDVLGEGRATFRACLLLPSGWLKDGIKSRSFHDQIKRWPPAMRAWGMATARVFLDERAYSIDLSRRIGMSKAEFTSAIDHIRNSDDPIVSYAQEALTRAHGSRGRNRIIDAAWQAARFRDLIRRERRLDEAREYATSERLVDLQKAAARRLAGFNPLSLGLPIIAMLALLQADSSDIRATPRSGRNSRQARDGRSGSPRPAAGDGMRIVTLNLEDRGLQSFYERALPKEDEEGGSALAHGHARIRHPVRGHLFLARNGIMTWRRPHWRGSLEQPAIHRVVAPSHAR